MYSPHLIVTEAPSVDWIILCRQHKFHIGNELAFLLRFETIKRFHTFLETL